MTNVDEVIKAYIKLRDDLDALKREQKEQTKPLYAKLQTLEAWLQHQLNMQGLKNFKGASGVAFIKRDTSATVRDWKATLAWIKETGLWEILEKRVSKSVVEDYIEASGEVPPGVEYKVEEVVQVRRG